MSTAFARKLGRPGSLVAEQLETYRRQTQKFRAKFGREMGPDDPFFFDPDSCTPQYRSAKDAEFAISLMVELMGEAGVDPSAIYAFKRTGGLFPAERSPLTADEEVEWSMAVDEYFEMVRNTPIQ